MKKLLILGLFVLFLSSCTTNTFIEDPSLKESERIAVLEKAKTDTLIIAVSMDKSTYLIKDNKILLSTSNEKESGLIFVIGIILGFLLGFLLVGLFSSNY